MVVFFFFFHFPPFLTSNLNFFYRDNESPVVKGMCDRAKCLDSIGVSDSQYSDSCQVSQVPATGKCYTHWVSKKRVHHVNVISMETTEFIHIKFSFPLLTLILVNCHTTCVTELRASREITSSDMRIHMAGRSQRKKQIAEEITSVSAFQRAEQCSSSNIRTFLLL